MLPKLQTFSQFSRKNKGETLDISPVSCHDNVRVERIQQAKTAEKPLDLRDFRPFLDFF
jgi:hypothetical protein